MGWCVARSPAREGEQIYREHCEHYDLVAESGWFDRAGERCDKWNVGRICGVEEERESEESLCAYCRSPVSRRLSVTVLIFPCFFIMFYMIEISCKP